MSLNDLEPEIGHLICKQSLGRELAPSPDLQHFAEHFQRALGQKQNKANALQIKQLGSPTLLNKIR